ncbi:MAG TPA: class I SAM-dependent methyltransferase [Myxococcota bacterium]|nr:class I SAM-dependent methyltransferase [Myxococcota bacterium]
MSDVRQLGSRLEHLLANDEIAMIERRRLIELMCLFADLPPPPDPIGLFPRYAELKSNFAVAADGDDPETLHESFLALYAHLHGYQAPYTPEERKRVDATGGYWCHAGGLSPILKAGDHIRAGTISADFGAGNGLQGLLFQKLYPHKKTIQIEISSKMIEAGRELQRWLGIPEEKVEWSLGDVVDHSPTGMDFIYIYRPLKPEGPGREFYRRFAAELARDARPVVIFSIADCLRDFLPASFEVFYGDGHLTCFERK